jgi:hypothetical protein
VPGFSAYSGMLEFFATEALHPVPTTGGFGMSNGTA